MLLVDIGQLHGFTAFKGTAIGLIESHNEAEEGGFTNTVGADYTDDTCGRQREVEVGVEHFLAK